MYYIAQPATSSNSCTRHPVSIELCLGYKVMHFLLAGAVTKRCSSKPKAHVYMDRLSLLMLQKEQTVCISLYRVA